MLATWGTSTGRNPTLDLQFAGATSLDNRITFSRGSTATYFDSTGTLQTASNDVARFDHNPSTLAAQGLLIEEQRTNLQIQSEDFTTSWAPAASSITANAAIAPSGTLTGDKLIEDATNAWHYVAFFSITPVASTAYTMSVFAKQGERNFVQLYLPSAAFGGSNAANSAVFDLSTGTIASQGGSLTGASITNVGNGWYRCVITKTSVGTTSFPFVITVNNSSAFSTTGYQGDGTSGIYIWGAQLEAGAFPTSYIPTTTTALTRNADVASMTGTNFSSWFNAAEGTLFSEFSSYASGARAIVGISDGTLNNRIQFFANAGDPHTIASRLVSGGTQTNPANTGSIAVGAIGKAALAYAVGTNQGAISVNGGAPTTSSPAAIAVGVNTLELGKGSALSNMSGYLRRISYYPVRLPDSTLQAITA